VPEPHPPGLAIIWWKFEHPLDTVGGVSQNRLKVLCERPPFLAQSFQEFEAAVRCAVRGDIAAGLEHLERTRHLEIREWFKTIGQNSGKKRFQELGSLEAKESLIERSLVVSGRVNIALARQVLQRDHYCCRYCGVQVIYASEARRIRKRFGAENFQMSQDNDIAHGTLRAFYNSFDHVVPRSRGGQNTADNIVTACYACNFGKDNFTVDQLGLDDPRQNPPVDSAHDGFVSLLG
jgi:5-methylcytosine-specific restriction endonuclease McrA